MLRTRLASASARKREKNRPTAEDGREKKMGENAVPCRATAHDDAPAWGIRRWHWSSPEWLNSASEGGQFVGPGIAGVEVMAGGRNGGQLCGVQRAAGHHAPQKLTASRLERDLGGLPAPVLFLPFSHHLQWLVKPADAISARLRERAMAIAVNQVIGDLGRTPSRPSRRRWPRAGASSFINHYMTIHPPRRGLLYRMHTAGLPQLNKARQAMEDWLDGAFSKLVQAATASSTKNAVTCIT
ncbi:hypothetical protein B0H67DRAFT_378500 [Lasiosphaeris hirsuta]|uniref:Uncharacterized protein n=1 Tax=Lasiosphaeris hirsuta TaxID=260670 RepID=A0AA40DLK9_9PEZI|nr:hypothetical protein B0H67DRAFT_378500 [Lasiosphaeris hirsuta]